MEQKSSENDIQIGAKIGAGKAPWKKSKLEAQNVEIHCKYVDFSDFQHPQKGSEKRRKRILKKAPPWLPKPGFPQISVGPLLFIRFGCQKGPKMNRKSGPKWTQKRASKRRQKQIRKRRQNDPKAIPNDPKTIPKRSQNDPKRHQNHTQTIPKRSTNCQKMVKKRTQNELKWPQIRSKKGLIIWVLSCWTLFCSKIGFSFKFCSGEAFKPSFQAETYEMHNHSLNTYDYNIFWNNEMAPKP